MSQSIYRNDYVCMNKQGVELYRVYDLLCVGSSFNDADCLEFIHPNYKQVRVQVPHQVY